MPKTTLRANGVPLANAGTITITDTVAGISPPAGATQCVIQVETGAVRWRDDGVNPTTTVGMKKITGNEGFVYKGDLSAFRWSRDGAVNATAHIAFYQGGRIVKPKMTTVDLGAPGSLFQRLTSELDVRVTADGDDRVHI